MDRQFVYYIKGDESRVDGQRLFFSMPEATKKYNLLKELGWKVELLETPTDWRRMDP